MLNESSPAAVLESFISAPPSRLLPSHLKCCVSESVSSKSMLLFLTCHSSHLPSNFSFILSTPPTQSIPYKHIFITISTPKLFLLSFCRSLIFHSLSSRVSRFEAHAHNSKERGVFLQEELGTPPNLTDLPKKSETAKSI